MIYLPSAPSNPEKRRSLSAESIHQDSRSAPRKHSAMVSDLRPLLFKKWVWQGDFSPIEVQWRRIAFDRRPISTAIIPTVGFWGFSRIYPELTGWLGRVPLGTPGHPHPYPPGSPVLVKPRSTSRDKDKQRRKSLGGWVDYDSILSSLQQISKQK